VVQKYDYLRYIIFKRPLSLFSIPQDLCAVQPKNVQLIRDKPQANWSTWFLQNQHFVVDFEQY